MKLVNFFADPRLVNQFKAVAQSQHETMSAALRRLMVQAVAKDRRQRLADRALRISASTTPADRV